MLDCNMELRSSVVAWLGKGTKSTVSMRFLHLGLVQATWFSFSRRVLRFLNIGNDVSREKRENDKGEHTIKNHL